MSPKVKVSHPGILPEWRCTTLPYIPGNEEAISIHASSAIRIDVVKSAYDLFELLRYLSRYRIAGSRYRTDLKRHLQQFQRHIDETGDVYVGWKTAK